MILETPALSGTVEARELTDQIKVAVEATWHLVARAYTTRAWALLGYPSWDDYCTRELVSRWGDKIDRTKLVNELQQTRPGVIIGKARTLRDVQGGTIGAALAKVLVGLHNNRKRSNLLPEWVWTR